MKLYPHQLPRDLVLDLIAVTRLLYSKEKTAGGHPVKLQAIADVGKALRLALDMAKCEPGTMGARAAWQHTDGAIEALGDLLKDEQALPLLKTVEARLLRIKQR